MLDSFLACGCVLECGECCGALARERQADNARSTSSENHTVRRPESVRAEVLGAGVFEWGVCIASSKVSGWDRLEETVSATIDIDNLIYLIYRIDVDYWGRKKRRGRERWRGRMPRQRGKRAAQPESARRDDRQAASAGASIFFTPGNSQA
ncbi:hypothetical protein [Paraburkholderia sp. J11-2]|uniref:hypothetical protein n=1 Tax=Paraburkholderia sp. J11-2 TaxID=2805431 RepID=UPI002AB72378|nr:hypothetical protein [Paraburkholderia sp. J11-2]